MADNDQNKDLEMDINPTNKPSINEVVAALQQSAEENEHVPAVAYYGLSDLDDASLRIFESVWNTLPADYKRKLIGELAEASEVNFDFDYEALGYLGLDDGDSSVRSRAIDLLWINESLSLLSRLIELAENDESAEVRARAAS